MKHECFIPSWEMKHTMYGNAIHDCYEDEEGRLIAQGEEYGNQVNFCPFCGYKAKVQIEYKPTSIEDFNKTFNTKEK